jgi:hypothetical protein
MNSFKQKLIERADIYGEFDKVKKIGLDRTKDVFSKLAEVTPKARIIMEEPTDDSISLRIFGFRVFIRFLIIPSNDIGCVQWFHVCHNPETQENEGTLIIEYFFDHLGNLYKSPLDKNSTVYSFQSEFWVFTYKTILEFCNQVDNNIFSHLRNVANKGALNTVNP